MTTTVRASIHGATWEVCVNLPKPGDPQALPELLGVEVTEVYDVRRFIEWIQERRANEK